MNGTLLLTRREVASLLDLDECIAAVEEAFRAHAEGRAIAPGVLSAAAEGGAFHVKTAGLLAELGTPSRTEELPGSHRPATAASTAARPYFAAKVNGNFYRNAERGLPRIQGLIVLCDAGNGTPLAVMDSTEITRARTGAATAVAAKYLARPDSAVATICGCGLQGRVQLRCLARVLPLERAYAFDVEGSAAARLAAELAPELGIAVVATDDLGAAVRESDVCVTCTPANRPLLGRGDLRPGSFLAAVGADSPEKQELEPGLLAAAKVVVDHLEQCATLGELHHALEAGVMSRSDVHAELHEVVAGRRPGRTSPEEIFVFDSTGVALQDVAAAALVFEKALAAGVGGRWDLLA